jgi:hypothetical protein
LLRRDASVFFLFVWPKLNSPSEWTYSEGGMVMGKRVRLVFSLVLCFLVIAVPSVWASWVPDGVPLCTAAYNQYVGPITSDGAGGAIAAWNDQRGGIYYDIYAQRVNASGIVQWTVDGVALCTAANDQMNLAIVPDGAGGAIIAWMDRRSATTYDVYAQRVNASGAVQWTANGVAVSTATGDQYSPTVVADGAGGAIVTWEDDRSGNYDIYAQRVNASGAVQWAANGVAFSTAIGDQQYPAIVSDGAGGAIVTWQDYRSGSSYDIYAQRVNASGIVQWTVDGVALCTAANDQRDPVIVPDGAGGATVTWADKRSGRNNIYAQRVNASGAVQWIVDGVAICTTAAYPEDFCRIATDCAGGAIAVWEDGRNDWEDIYAQCINRYGHPGFGYEVPDGLAVKDVPGDQGGKLTIQWDASYLDLFSPHSVLSYSVWRRLAALGGAALDGKVLLSADEGIPARLEGRETQCLLPESGYAWEWIASIPARQFERYAYTAQSLRDSMGTDPGWQYFLVCAQTADPLVYYDSPIDSGYSVDNLDPYPPQHLAGARSDVPEGLRLTWARNTENDFKWYAVYRGVTGDFVPGAGNLIASQRDTVYFDGEWRWSSGYYYKVSAIDVHGNESSFALLAPEAVTGTETPKAPEATYLAQNFPNPFNPMTRITFGLKEPTRVSLRIYDVAGRLVRVLVEGDRPAGLYAELWNGCDAVGRAAASGLYFYRLDAGSFTQTRKMILLR